MPIRQQNVLAAKWSPNGDTLGAPDLTVSDNQIFGENVFSSAIQRQRLSSYAHYYRLAPQTSSRGWRRRRGRAPMLRPAERSPPCLAIGIVT